MVTEQHPESAPPPVFQCARCGVESSEPTCFVIPGPHDSPPRDIRCITCEERRHVPSTAATFMVVVGSLVWPLIFLATFGKGSFQLGLPVLVVACLLYPVAIVAHELGHAVAGSLLGLEVGAIELGSGRVVSKFVLLGLPTRLHMWPISGCVYLGSPSLDWLRARLWVAVLMGPMTNALLVVATVTWWQPLESVLGPADVGLWFWVNLIMVIVNLIPQHTMKMGRLQSSDGLLLLTLPFRKREQLTVYRTNALVSRALFHYEEDNSSDAANLMTAALRREPENDSLRVLQAMCYLANGDYGAGLDIIKPLADRPAAGTAQLRATVCNSAAFGLTMLTIGAATTDPQLSEADRLSGVAFSMFPCVLGYRLTRALVLTATDRPLQALQLLEYPLFQTARPKQQAQHAAVRTFAHRQLGNLTESEGAAARAIQLDASIISILRSLGIAPSPTARPLPPPKPAILSPGGWVVLAIAFAGLGLLMCATAFTTKTGATGALAAAAGLFAFAAVCWKARAARRP